jgi:hypothetical protein
MAASTGLYQGSEMIGGGFVMMKAEATDNGGQVKICITDKSTSTTGELILTTENEDSLLKEIREEKRSKNFFKALAKRIKLVKEPGKITISIEPPKGAAPLVGMAANKKAKEEAASAKNKAEEEVAAKKKTEEEQAAAAAAVKTTLVPTSSAKSLLLKQQAARKAGFNQSTDRAVQLLHRSVTANKTPILNATMSENGAGGTKSDDGIDVLSTFLTLAAKTTHAPTSSVESILLKQRDAELDALRKEMEALKAGTKTTPSTTTTKDHFTFISYAKTDSLAETKIVSEFVAAKFPGRSLFRDTEQHFALSTLIDNVSRSTNVLVFLTPNYPKRPYCLIEIHHALKHGVNVVTIKIRKPGLDMFDFNGLNKALASESTLQGFIEPSVWDVLKENGITVSDVRADLKKIMDVKAFTLDMDEPKEVQDVMMEMICRGLKV